MRSFSLIYLLVPFILMSGCTKPDHPSTSLRIRFEVNEPTTKTGTFISSENPDLRNACTPADDNPAHRGLGIGIWAEMHDNAPSPHRNVFNGVKLIYKTGAHDEEPDHLSWNTDQDLYWSIGEHYYFRAFYPATLVPAGNSTASVLFTEYRPEQLQEDLMFAYWHTGEIYLETDPAGARYTATNTHVPLVFHHALSALKFSFRFSYPNTDYLTACWLENTGSNQFCTYGMLAYGKGSAAPPDDTQEYKSGYPHYADLDNSDSVEYLHWFQTASPPAGAKMYEWRTAQGQGVQFSNETSGSAYFPTSDGDDATTDTPQAGLEFIRNEGWIYIIPQAIHTGTQICFQTLSGGDNVFRVNIPSPIEGDATFQRACRYQITLTIGATDIDAMITILPWHRLNAYHSIDYSD